jgi:predicted transcriptional regulator
VTTESSLGPNAIELAVELTVAWLGNSNTRVSVEEVSAFVASMRDSVLQLNNRPDEMVVEEAPSVSFTPAVSARKSLASRDHIISLIDGKPYKTLRRHLSGHGLTAEEYRRRYNLKADYPMVAEAYSEVRRAMAMRIGLGRKPGSLSTPTDSSSPKRRRLKLSTPAE